MFDFLNFKSVSDRKAEAGVEATFRHGHTVWDSADVERRTSLLRRVIDIQDDRLFLAYVHAPWSQIPNEIQVKLALAVMAQEETHALTIKMDRISALGHKAGETVARRFSAEQFSEFFGQKPLAPTAPSWPSENRIVGSYQAWEKGGKEGLRDWLKENKLPNWNSEEALGTWYALGRFCFLISIGSLEDVRDADMNSLIVSGEGGLLATWRMPESAMRRFEHFNGTKLADAYSVYKLINNGEMFSRFFSLFVAEILGNDISFSANDFSNGTLGQLPRGERVEMDPFLANDVSSMFVKTKQAIQPYVCLQLSEIYHNFALALRPY
jgi:hypothetical protein